MRFDVCLILEGTFPYVHGGVSSWVYDLICRMPDVSFALFYLGTQSSEIKTVHYPIPKNVLNIEKHYLFDYEFDKESKKYSRDNYDKLYQFIMSIKHLDISFLKTALDLFSGDNGISIYDFVYSEASWEVLKKVHKKEANTPSFIDYFWTWRFTLVPFFSLLQCKLPMAKLYHAVSTGYAGVLGAVANLQYKRPLLLTEHAIYTRERRLEIMQSDWIFAESLLDISISDEKNDFFRQWWIDIFSYFSLATYSYAEKIVTLCDKNKLLQIQEGARAEKISIIPNGIDSSLYRSKENLLSSEVATVAIVGRIVPIKDIKTFIRACSLVLKTYKAVRFEIIGSSDEDREYFRDCRQLVEQVGLTDNLLFMGKQDMSEYYHKIDLLVLTSISEAQPLVILEAGACGIPIVATDVGECRELLYGKAGEDELIGRGGIITPVCDPVSTAQAIIALLTDKKRYYSMSHSIKKRVYTYYRAEELIANYHALYSHYMEKIPWQE